MGNFKWWYIYVLTLTILTFSWIGLESVVDGQIISQTSDDIIAIISSYFITDWIYCRYIYKTKGKVVKHNDKNDM